MIDRAIGSDQGIKFVDVVDEKNQVQTRRVTTGALQEDGLRVIAKGLQADEWVIVGGLQQVRPHMTVQTEKVPMPSLAPHHEAEASPGTTSRATTTQPVSSEQAASSPPPSPAAQPTPPHHHPELR